MPYLFKRWSTNLLVSVGQTTRQRINYTFTSTKHFQRVAQSAYLSLLIGDGIFYSVPYCVLFAHYSFLLA